MKYKLIKIFFACLMLFQATLLFSQQADKIIELEQRLKVAQLQRDNLAVSINTMMAETDSLSEVVQALRQKPSLNIAERNQLENLLKKSQAISNQQESAALQHKRISQKIKSAKSECLWTTRALPFAIPGPAGWPISCRA